MTATDPCSALVTGAFGFTGGHLARRLVDDGWRVRGFDLAAMRENAAAMPEVEAVFGDLVTGEGIDDAPRSCEVVFHVASVVATSSRPLAQAVIVDGTRRLAEAAVRHGVRRLVYVSSTAVYGHGPLMDADEETPRRPEDPYGEAKAQAEDLLLEMHGRGDLEVVVLRPRLIYGPGDRHFLPTACEALRKRQVVLVNGGRAINDIVHVSDLVEALLRAAEVPQAAGRIFNITSGEAIPSREFFNAVADRFGLPRPRLNLPYPVAWLLAAALTLSHRLTRGPSTSYSPLKRLRLLGSPHHFSIVRARQELGYEPRVVFGEGLEKL